MGKRRKVPRRGTHHSFCQIAWMLEALLLEEGFVDALAAPLDGTIRRLGTGYHDVSSGVGWN